jgi:hypothetical protein
LHYKVADIAEIYMHRVAKLHRVPNKTMSEKDSKFTSNVWKGLFKGLGTSLNFNTTYIHELDGQTERVNQMIEEMLRMCVMDKTLKWED